jgi:hypothetical protein
LLIRAAGATFTRLLGSQSWRKKCIISNTISNLVHMKQKTEHTFIRNDGVH